MVEAEFFLRLLMGLVAGVPPLDGGGQRAQIGPHEQVGEIMPSLPGGAVLADEPGFVAWELQLSLVANPLRYSIGRAHTHGREAGLQCALRAHALVHLPPLGFGQHVLAGTDGDRRRAADGLGR